MWIVKLGWKKWCPSLDKRKFKVIKLKFGDFIFKMYLGAKYLIKFIN
jgi:hypothetical protein